MSVLQAAHQVIQGQEGAAELYIHSEHLLSTYYVPGFFPGTEPPLPLPLQLVSLSHQPTASFAWEVYGQPVQGSCRAVLICASGAHIPPGVTAWS